MNLKFFDLPTQKQQRIITSALEIFSMQDYRKASTDKIIHLAGISKGLLFHYFESKKGLYFYCFEYAKNIVLEEFSALHLPQERDFFVILQTAQLAKMKVMKTHPFVFEFLVKAYLEEEQELKEAIHHELSLIQNNLNAITDTIDKSKFLPFLDIPKVLKLIHWASEGFLIHTPKEKFKDLEALNETYLEYMDILRKSFYQEMFWKE